MARTIVYDHSKMDLHHLLYSMEGDRGISQQATEISNELSVDAQKKQRWQQVVTELDTTKDRLGLGIDGGIFETVAALQVLDINTTQSCEGHLERGVAAPWVDIAAPETAESLALKEQLRQIMDREEQAELQGLDDEELAKLYAERQRLQKEVQAPHLREMQKAMQHLSAFYETRHVPYDRQLIMVHGRIQSQGAELQQIVPTDVKQAKLLEYQTELHAFTAFLKERYFSSETH